MSEQFVYARTRKDPCGPARTHSVASSSDSLISASHQADVMLAPVTTAGLDSLCGVGVLGLIIMSNLNRVRLSCCWVGVGL